MTDPATMLKSVTSRHTQVLHVQVILGTLPDYSPREDLSNDNSIGNHRLRFPPCSQVVSYWSDSLIPHLDEMAALPFFFFFHVGPLSQGYDTWTVLLVRSGELRMTAPAPEVISPR